MTGLRHSLFLITALFCLTGCAPRPAHLAARIGPDEITVAELSAETRRQLALRGHDFDTYDPARVYEMASMILTGMLDEKAAEQRAGAELIAKTRARVAKFNPAQGDPASVRQDIYRGLLIERIAQRDNLNPPQPTVADLRAIFDRDPSRWSLPAESDVRLYVENLEPRDLKAPSRAACRQRVERARAANTPGVPMTVRHGSSQPQLDAMALRTPVTATSPVFQLGPGHAYVEVITRRPAVPQSFAQSREQMQRVIGEKWHRDYFVRLRQQWREESRVEVVLCHDTLRQPERPVTLLAHMLIVAAAVCGLLTAAWWSWRSQTDGKWLWAVLVLGCVVRVAYWANTPYHWLGYDWEEHLDYIGYVGTMGAIPDWAAGFMFSQPPLYYWICATVGSWVGDLFDPRWYQTVGLIFSCVALWFGLDALAMVTGHKQSRGPVRAAMCVLVVLPSLVFLAARVNNDCLVVMLGFAMVWFLIRWWTRGQTWAWFGAVMVTGLGLLTKSTALLWVPVLGVCLLTKANTTWRARLQLAGLAGIILVAMDGWLIAWRLSGEQQRDLAANVSWADAHVPIHADPHIRALVAFQPQRIWHQPYAHSLMPSLTRDNFWEFFLRTAWYGEFSYRDVPLALVRALVMTGLLMLLVVAVVAGRQVQQNWREALPSAALLVVVLAGHLVYRQTVPMACSQDFRYSMILLFPACYFLACAPRWAGWPAACWVALSVCFLGVICFF